MHKVLNFIGRLAASPFVLGLLIIAFAINLLSIFLNFLMYGGEFLEYHNRDKVTIKDLYNKLKNNNE